MIPPKIQECLVLVSGKNSKRNSFRLLSIHTHIGNFSSTSDVKVVSKAKGCDKEGSQTKSYSMLAIFLHFPLVRKFFSVGGGDPVYPIVLVC